MENQFIKKHMEKMKQRMQQSMENDFAKTHDLIMENYVPKDKGSMRNINNYRMKLWCDMFIEYKKNSYERSLAASYASKDLEMFDLQFNQ